MTLRCATSNPGRLVCLSEFFLLIFSLFRAPAARTEAVDHILHTSLCLLPNLSPQGGGPTCRCRLMIDQTSLPVLIGSLVQVSKCASLMQRRPSHVPLVVDGKNFDICITSALNAVIPQTGEVKKTQLAAPNQLRGRNGLLLLGLLGVLLSLAFIANVANIAHAQTATSSSTTASSPQTCTGLGTPQEDGNCQGTGQFGDQTGPDIESAAVAEVDG